MVDVVNPCAIGRHAWSEWRPVRKGTGSIPQDGRGPVVERRYTGTYYVRVCTRSGCSARQKRDSR